MDTLPIAGTDGTLSRRFKGTAAEGIVRAKTGYISRVVALSGYIPRPDADNDGFADGKPLVFSMLFNNFTCPTSTAKNAIDRLVVTLAESLGHPAR